MEVEWCRLLSNHKICQKRDNDNGTFKDFRIRRSITSDEEKVKLEYERQEKSGEKSQEKSQERALGYWQEKEKKKKRGM